MREYPKIRKTAKWGGLAVAMVAVAVWAGTRRCQLAYMGTNWEISVWGHGVWCERVDGSYSIMDRGWKTRSAVEWRVIQLRPWSTFGDRYMMVYIPFWMPALGASLIAAGAWRLDVLAARRRRAGACTKCGYDRAGIRATSPCPECGAVLVTDKADATLVQPTSPQS